MPAFGYFVCILGYVMSCLHAATVTWLKPCKFEDSGCLLDSSQAAVPHLAHGIPEHGIHAFDPLVLEQVRGDQGELLLEFQDLHVTGLSKCKFTSFRTVNKTNVSFDADCPILAIGKYTAGGKLLFIPIEGSGPFELKTERLSITVNVVIETTEGDDGKKRWHVKDIDYSYDPVERIYIQLGNLFNGDEKKAKPILEILNNSWKELILEIGRPIIDKLMFQLRDVINEFFLAVPLDELIL